MDIVYIFISFTREGQILSHSKLQKVIRDTTIVTSACEDGQFQAHKLEIRSPNQVMAQVEKNPFVIDNSDDAEDTVAEDDDCDVKDFTLLQDPHKIYFLVNPCL